MEGNMREALQYKLALRGSRLENFEKALGNYKYPMTNIFKPCSSSSTVHDKDPPIIISGYSFETSEVLGALKGATALEESYLLKQAALYMTDEDGLTSSEGSSVFREGSPELEQDDYLIGQAFSLDGCEEAYFEKYAYSPEMNYKHDENININNNCNNNSPNSSRSNSRSRKSSKEEEELYEPEVEIFEMDL